MKYYGDIIMSIVQEKLREVGIDSFVIFDIGWGIEGKFMIYIGDFGEDVYIFLEFLSENVIMFYYVEIFYYKYRLDILRGLDYWK